MRRILILVAMFAWAAALLGSPPTSTAPPFPVPRVQVAISPFDISLPCARLDYNKVVVSNNTQKTIPKGTKIHGIVHSPIIMGLGCGGGPESSDEEWALTAWLAPGQQVQFSTAVPCPGECWALIRPGLPDLEVQKVTRVGKELKLQIRNNNPLSDAGASTAKVRMLKCSQIELTSILVAVPPVPAGQSVTVITRLAPPPGFEYFDVVVDCFNTVRESNENNNAYTEVGVCIR